MAPAPAPLEQAVMDRVLQSATSRKRPREEEAPAPEDADAAEVVRTEGATAAATGSRAVESADDAELRALLERADEIKVSAPASPTGSPAAPLPQRGAARDGRSMPWTSTASKSSSTASTRSLHRIR